MRRKAAGAAVCAGLVCAVALAGCSAAPGGARRTAGPAWSATAPPATTPTATTPPATTSPATAPPATTPPAVAFTVAGDRPVAPGDSQDTYAQTPGAVCDGAAFASDEASGERVAAGFALAGFPAASSLLTHFLRGSGTAVGYPAGSRISALARRSGAFAAVNEQVQDAVGRQLAAGRTRVRLSPGELPTVSFGDTSSDLYWAFRGTQGLTVTGRGTRVRGRYTGTLTYVIRDSYGFPASDTLDGFGPPMRYLQTVCGAPRHRDGARWFPDTITVTVPFSGVVRPGPG